jgi:hypothetical protein
LTPSNEEEGGGGGGEEERMKDHGKKETHVMLTFTFTR